MGGGMAMHLAYRYHQDVAGVFALSSFLSKTSAVYQVGTELFANCFSHCGHLKSQKVVPECNRPHPQLSGREPVHSLFNIF